MPLLPEDTMGHDLSRVREPGRNPKQEQHIVERLAQETETPEPVARRTYEDERERLERDARVKAFVSIIAARHAKDTLRSRKQG